MTTYFTNLLQNSLKNVESNRGNLLVVLFICLSTFSFSQIQINITESFEDDGQASGRFNAYRFDNGNDEFFLERSDADFTDNMTGETGTNYWAFGRLEQGSNTNPLSPQGSIEFADLNISGFENIEISMDLGTLGGGEYESNDFLAIYANIDGGGDVLVGNFRHNTNELQRDTDLNGTADDADFDLTSTFRTFTFPVSGSGQILNITIIGTNDSDNGLEITTLDKIEVHGTLASDVLAKYTFPAGSGIPLASATNFTAGTFTESAGLIFEDFGDTFSYNSWDFGGTDYYEFSASPAATFHMTLTNLTFNQDKENSNTPDNWVLRSSIDNYVSDIATAATLDDDFAADTDVDLTGGTFDNIQAVTFRLYGLDAAGSGAAWKVDNVELNGTVQPDAIAPTITNITPIPTDDNYILGENLDFTVNFSEPVTITGSPRIEITLTSGGPAYATVQTPGTASSFVFRYTVGSDDVDTDIVLNSPIQLNSGTILDGAANPATITYTPPATDGINVDAVAPTILNITRDTPTTSPTNADLLIWDVEFSETVTGVDNTDFQVSNTDATISVGVPTGNVYPVTISGGTDLANLNNTVTLTLNTPSINDAFGNALTNLSSTGTNNNAFLVDNTPPATPTGLDLATADDSGTNTADDITKNNNNLTISGSREANSSIQLYNGGAPIGTATTNGTGTWNKDITLAEGVHNISAKATDLAGNESLAFSTDLVITVDNTPPTLQNILFYPNSAESNGNREVLIAQITEEITLDGTNPAAFPGITLSGNGIAPGFFIEVSSSQVSVVGGSGSGIYSESYNNYQNDDVTRPISSKTTEENTSTRIIHFEGANKNAWGDLTVNPTISYNTGGGITDLAGNAMGNLVELPSIDGDATPPTISQDIELYPNGTSPETIVINFSEVINLADATPVTGFTVTNLNTANYDELSNTVILTSLANGQWDLSTTVAYSSGTGNIIDGTNIPLASITIDGVMPTDDPIDLVYETVPPEITALTVTSSNTPNDLANGGDQVTIAFTTDDGLNVGTIALSNVTSGGIPIADLVYVYNTVGVNQYTAVIDIAGIDTNDAIAFNLTFDDEAGNTVASTVTVGDITSGTTVTVDNLAPTVTIASSDGDAIVKDSPDVTITATFIEANGIDETPVPTITIGTLVVGEDMSRTSNLIWTYLWDVPAGNDGSHAITINGPDDAGNALGTQSGQTSFEIDNTISGLSFTTLEDGAQTSFAITFNEQLSTATTSITDIANLLSSATNDFGGNNDAIDVSSVGGSVSWNTSTPSAPIATITIPSTDLVVARTLRINFVTSAVVDVAGNEVSNATNFDGVVTDITPPLLAPDEMSLSLNGGSPETIQFTINEELNVIEGFDFGPATFSVNAGLISSAIYSGKGTTNTITLTSTSNGVWTAGSTQISYTSGNGVQDLAGINLATITNHATVSAVEVTMAAGDIAFSYYNSDNEDFAFVLLRDMTAGEQIRFTDNGWTGSSFTVNGNYITWTATANILAGTEIVMDSDGASTYTITPVGSSSFSGDMISLSSSYGDQIIAYQGSTSNPTFITGIHMDYSASNVNTSTEWSDIAISSYYNRSVIPTGLTKGTNAVSPGYPAEIDNGIYNVVNGLTGDASTIRSLLNDRTNWTTSNSSSGVTIPTAGINFIIPPNVNTLTPTTGSRIKADFATLQITFDENIATDLTFGGNITIDIASGGANVLTYPIASTDISVLNNVVSIDISGGLGSLVNGTTYEVNVDDFIFENAAGYHNESIDGNSTWTFTYDSDVPDITSIVRADGNPTSATSVDYTVTFDQDVSNVDITDFDLDHSASATGATIASLTPAGPASVYTVTVNTINLIDASVNSSLLRLDLTDDNTILDDALNPFGGNGTENYTAGATYEIVHPEPDGPATSFAAGAVTTSSISLSWQDPTPSDPQVPNRFLIIASTSSGATLPTDLTEETEDLDGTDGFSQRYIDFQGAEYLLGTYTYVFPNLGSSQQYFFQIIPATNNAGNIDYNTTSVAANEVTGTTAAASDNTITFVSAIATIDPLDNVQGDVTALAGNFVFDIVDDGGVAPDPDISPTLINEIIIRQDVGNDEIVNWTEAIEDAELSDGVTTMLASSFDDTSITFTGITNGDEQLGEIDDDETKRYTLKIWLKTSMSTGVLDLPTIIDGLNFVFDVDQADISVEGSGSSRFEGTQSANSGTGNNAVDVDYSDLEFTTEPSTTGFTLTDLVQPPVIAARDANNNIDLDYSAVSNVANTGVITMQNVPASFTNGVLSIPNLQYNTPGNGTLIIIDTDGVDADGVTSTGVTISVDNQSDIIENTAFAHSSNIAYQSYREADIVVDGSGEIEMAQFIIRDGAGSGDNDGSPTVVTSISFDITNSANIKNVALYSAGVELGEVAGAGTITFPGLTLSTTTDGGTTTISLFVTFNDNVTDDEAISFTVNTTTTDSDNSSFAAADAGGNSTSLASDENRIEVTATKFVFTQQPPTTVNAQVDVSPSPVVQAQDALNNLDINFTETVVSTVNARIPTQIPMTDEPDTGDSFVLGVLDFAVASPNFSYDEPSQITGDAALTVTTASLTQTSTAVTSVVSQLSDIIIEETVFDYPTDVDFTYLDYDTESAYLEIADFIITDGGDGNASDSDNADTELTSLTLNFANFSSIREVGIYDGNTLVSDIKTLDGSGNVTFDDGDGLPLSITALDNGTKTFNVRVNFDPTVVDNEQFTVQITGASANQLFSRFLTADGGAAITTLGASDNKIEVVADRVIFTTNPHASNISTFTDINSPAIVVEAQDVNLNTDLDYVSAIGTVTTQNFTPTNPLTFNLVSSGNFIAGVYDFAVQEPTLQFTSDGLSGELLVSATGITDGTSTTFNVSASQESYITYVSDGGDIAYRSYPPTAPSGLTNANSYSIAEFQLHDGNPTLNGDEDGSGGDLDGANTVLDDLTISITNFENLDEVGVFDAGGTQYGADMTAAGTITFTGMNFIATDNLTNNFFIRASFKDTSADITDNDVIDVAITNVVSGGGSKFEDNVTNYGGEPDGGGAFIAPVTPANNNVIRVTATELHYLAGLEPIDIGVGADFPTPPQVESTDDNGIRDVDWSADVAITNSLTLNMDNDSKVIADPSFTAGIFTFPSNFSFTQAGNTTINVNSTGILSSNQATFGPIVVSISTNTLIVGGVAPATLSSLAAIEKTIGDADGPALLWTFDITDDNGLVNPGHIAINDTIPSQISQIIIKKGVNNTIATWSDVIAKAALIVSGVDTVVIASGVGISADEMIFSGINNSMPADDLGHIADGTTRTYQLYVILKGGTDDDGNPVPYGGTYADNIDGQDFDFEIDETSISIVSNSSTFASVTNPSTDAIEVEVIATQLTFDETYTGSQQPDPTADYGTILNTQTIATARDINFTLDLDYGNAPLNQTVTVANLSNLNDTDDNVSFSNGQVLLNSSYFYDLGGADAADGSVIFTDDNDAFSATTSTIIVSYSNDSDIIKDVTGFTYEMDISYKDFQEAAAITDANSVLMESFTLRDGGAGDDSDGTPTELSSISIDIVNWENLRRIELFDGAGTTALASSAINEQNVTTNLLTFSGLSFSTLTDNANVDFTIRATFNSIVEDNEKISFTITDVVTSVTGSQLQNTDGSTVGAVIPASVLGVDDNKIEVDATQIDFTTNPDPTNISTFTNIDSPYLVVEARDLNTNTDLDYNTNGIGAVTTQNFTPNNPLSFNFPLPNNFVAGVYDFQVQAPTWQIVSDGENGELVISAAGLTDGVSSTFSVAASEDSYIKLVSSPANVFYEGFHASTITDANSVEIARFRLVDGLFAGASVDIDGANTEIDQLVLSLENHGYLSQVGIFIDGTSTPLGIETDQAAAATLTWNNLGIVAPDNDSIEFVVRASFQTTVTDNEPINVSIASVTEAGGSRFPQTNPDRTTATIKSTSDVVGNNLLEVVASKFVFTTEPSDIEGQNILWFGNPSNPLVEARDGNDIVDLDVNEIFTVSGNILSSANTSIETPDPVAVPLITSGGASLSFVDGVLDLTDLRYNDVGVGTLNIIDNSGSGIATGTSIHVDIINTVGSEIEGNGIESNLALIESGKQNIAILGFTLSSDFNNGLDPRLNSVKVTFERSANEKLIPKVDQDALVITNIFEDFRIFSSKTDVLNASFLNATNLTSTVSLEQDSIIVFSGLNIDIDANLDDQHFFLVVNVSVDADNNSLEVAPFIADNDIVMSAGSFQTTGNIIGLPYQFNDSKVPVLDFVNLNPLNKEKSTPVGTTFTAAFDEDVTSMDSVIFLHKQIDNTFIKELTLLSGNGSRELIFEYLDDHDNDIETPEVLIELEPETDYYITIPEGDVTNGVGIRDNKDNVFAGILNNTTWTFKSQDITEPLFIDNDLTASGSNEIIQISNVNDVSFTMTLQMDEKATIDYVVVNSSSSFNPESVDLFNINNSVPGYLTHGQMSIDIPLIDHTSFVTIPEANASAQAFKVYAIATDANGNSQKITSAIIADGDGRFGNGYILGQSAFTLGSASPDGLAEILVSDAPVCVGDPQPNLTPIMIREYENDDFSDGFGNVMYFAVNSDDEVFFQTDSSFVIDHSPSIIIDENNTGYEGDGLFKITFDVVNTSANRDYFLIDNIYFNSTTNSAAGIVKKISGYADIANDITIVNLSSYNSSIEPNFTFDPVITSIAEVDTTIVLIPDPTLISGLSNVFSGNGVFIRNDSTIFNPSISGTGAQEIELVHRDQFGCTSSKTEVINVFSNEGIEALNTQYCVVPGEILTQADTVDIGFNSQVGFRLFDLVVNTDGVNNKAAITTEVIIDNGDGGFYFFPSKAGAEVDQDVVEIRFEARFINTLNNADTVTIPQFVTISEAPKIISFLSSDGDFSNNPIDFCEDDSDIVLSGRIDRTIHLNTADSIHMVAWDTSLREFIKVDDQSSLTDDFAGGGTVFPSIIEGNDDLGIGEYIFRYSIKNNETSCTNSDTLKLNINPKPVANFILETVNSSSRFVGCVDDDLSFVEDSSSKQATDELFFEWSFDDPNAPTSGENGNSSDIRTPIHTYSTRSSHDISLSVTTDKGCISLPKDSVLSIGNNPKPSFTYNQIGIDENTEFQNTTSGLEDIQADSVISSSWVYDTNFAPIILTNEDGGNSLGNTEFKYPNLGVKHATLTTTSYNGCSETFADSIFVVRVISVSEDNLYSENFSGSTSDDWIPWGGSANSSPTWTQVASGADNNNSIRISESEDNTNFWITADGAYTQDSSYLYSPIFNISLLERPLITLDNFTDLNEGTDGVFIEYSTNGIFGDWTLLGELGSGIDWYNTSDIGEINLANFAQNPNNEGFSMENSGWRESKNTLSDLSGENRVQFRITFVSNSANDSRDGFAFNGIQIGERTRTVLVENFTNTSQTDAVFQESEFLHTGLVAEDDVDVIKLNYHTDFPGADPINDTNPTIHGSRASYYNVSTIPLAILDGDKKKTDDQIASAELIDEQGYFSDWGQDEFDKSSLELAEFDIDLIADIDPTDGLVNISATMSMQSVDTDIIAKINDLILQVAIVQDEVSFANDPQASGQTMAYDVVRDMLPNGAGTFIPKSEFSNGASVTRSFKWVPSGETDATKVSSPDIIDLDLLSVVAFIQDEEDQIVYQAFKFPLNSITVNTVTDIDNLEDPKFSLYPNPATDQVTLSFGSKINNDYLLKVYDRFGKQLHSQNIEQGTQYLTFDTQSYINGFYFIQVESKEKIITRKKLIIMKR
jgi:hypothetical protein